MSSGQHKRRDPQFEKREALYMKLVQKYGVLHAPMALLELLRNNAATRDTRLSQVEELLEEHLDEFREPVSVEPFRVERLHLLIGIAIREDPDGVGHIMGIHPAVAVHYPGRYPSRNTVEGALTTLADRGVLRRHSRETLKEKGQLTVPRPGANAGTTFFSLWPVGLRWLETELALLSRCQGCPQRSRCGMADEQDS